MGRTGRGWEWVNGSHPTHGNAGIGERDVIQEVGDEFCMGTMVGELAEREADGADEGGDEFRNPGLVLWGEEQRRPVWVQPRQLPAELFDVFEDLFLLVRVPAIRFWELSWLDLVTFRPRELAAGCHRTHGTESSLCRGVPVMFLANLPLQFGDPFLNFRHRFYF